MNYNDYKLASESQSLQINQSFDSVQALEVQDLEEIYEKLLNQKNTLENMNTDGKYDTMLSMTKNNIDTLSRLLNKKTLAYKQAKAQQNNPDDTHGKIPSRVELERHKNNQPSLSSPNQNSETEIVPAPNTPSIPEYGPPFETPDTNSEIVPAPNTPINNGVNTNPNMSMPNNPAPTQPNPAQRTNKRHSPMQSSIFSFFAKALALKKNRHSKSNTIEIFDRNKFHQVLTQEECQPRRKYITGQLDLLRLMLLFIALRPTCKYMSTISKIASQQFDILMQIM